MTRSQGCACLLIVHNCFPYGLHRFPLSSNVYGSCANSADSFYCQVFGFVFAS